LLFIPGVAMVLALPAATWALIAGERLKKFAQDFRALTPGLWLLFLVSVGTIVFPVITALVLRTDMEPIWALQGLFLFAILIVCAANYPIERFYSVNLAVTVIGIAVLAVGVVAPVHALYRNKQPLHEGRNFYQNAAAELTRQWHAQFDTALAAVGGDDDLAFAVAFYSPDHPVYTRGLVTPSRQLPDPSTLARDGQPCALAKMPLVSLISRGSRRERPGSSNPSSAFNQHYWVSPGPASASPRSWCRLPQGICHDR
jgi:hypothetical protein